MLIVIQVLTGIQVYQYWIFAYEFFGCSWSSIPNACMASCLVVLLISKTDYIQTRILLFSQKNIPVCRFDILKQVNYTSFTWFAFAKHRNTCNAFMTIAECSPWYLTRKQVFHSFPGHFLQYKIKYKINSFEYSVDTD